MRGTGAHLVITDVDAEDTGTYTCIATNGFGSQRADILLIVEGNIISQVPYSIPLKLSRTSSMVITSVYPLLNICYLVDGSRLFY